MFWAEQTGLGTVLEKLRAHHEAGRGEILAPAPLIERLAGADKGFAELDKGEAA